jgi:hypothetical protein
MALPAVLETEEPFDLRGARDPICDPTDRLGALQPGFAVNLVHRG